MRMYIVIHCLLLVVRFISMLNIGFHKNNINDTIIYCDWCIGQHIMMYSNIIVIKNYDILHVIANIMCLCIIKHPGPNASTVSTPTTTNERLPAQPKERLPRIPNSTVSRGCYWCPIGSTLVVRLFIITLSFPLKYIIYILRVINPSV